MNSSCKYWLRWIIVTICIAYVIYFFYDNPDDIAQLFDISPFILIGIAGLITASHLLYGYRFFLGLKKISGQPIPVLACIRISIIARFLSSFAPQAGNIYRGYVIKKKYQISYTQYLSTAATFSWLDNCFSLFYIFGVVVILEPNLMFGTVRITHLAIISLAVLFLTPFLLNVFFLRIQTNHPYAVWLHTRLSELLCITTKSVRDISFLSAMQGTGVMAILLIMAFQFLAFLAFGCKLSVSELALFHFLLRLTNQLIITPGNIGVSEILYGITSNYLHIGMAEGLKVALTLRIVGSLVIIFLGMLFGGMEELRTKKKVLR